MDDLPNADEATKERLKRCAGSASANFASLHRLIFDYDLETEAAQLPLDASGKSKGVDRGFSHGTVYWRDGSVRYDNFPIGKFGPNGQKLIYKKPKVQSVVRSQDMLAYTEQNAAWGLFLTVVKPPRSAEEWEYQTAFAPHRHLDPWLHYAQPFVAHRKMLRDFWENCRAIESEEAGGKVLLRFLRANANNNTRVEITCDAAADWLPAQLRAGEMQDGKWSLFIDMTLRMEEDLRRLVPEPPRQDRLFRDRSQTRQGDRSDRPEPAGQRRRQCAGIRLQLERHERSRGNRGPRQTR